MNLVEIVVRTNSTADDGSWSEVEVSVNGEFACGLNGVIYEDAVAAFEQLAEALGADVRVEVFDE